MRWIRSFTDSFAESCSWLSSCTWASTLSFICSRLALRSANISRNFMILSTSTARFSSGDKSANPSITSSWVSFRTSTASRKPFLRSSIFARKSAIRLISSALGLLSSESSTSSDSSSATSSDSSSEVSSDSVVSVVSSVVSVSSSACTKAGVNITTPANNNDRHRKALVATTLNWLTSVLIYDFIIFCNLLLISHRKGRPSSGRPPCILFILCSGFSTSQSVWIN